MANHTKYYRRFEQFRTCRKTASLSVCVNGLYSLSEALK